MGNTPNMVGISESRAARYLNRIVKPSTIIPPLNKTAELAPVTMRPSMNALESNDVADRTSPTPNIDKPTR
jgi:hypothetical protein